MQYTRNDLAFQRGTFRVRGDTVEIIPVYEEPRDPHRVLRRRDRGDLHAAPADRRGGARRDRDVRLPGHPLRRRARADGAGDRGHRGRAWRSGSRSSRASRSCSRRSGCACARPTTSR
nr:hypothetical protein [Angustibacter aerolatus]